MSEVRDKNRQDRRRDDAIRTFICIEVPDSIKNRIASLQQELKRLGAQVSWTNPANIHLTIKFLGDVAVSKLDTVRGAVERAIDSMSEFEIEVGGAGCFPAPKNPRVLWVGLTNIPDALRALHKRIEDGLARGGFEREQKRFSPHLTIGRIRGPHNAKLVVEKLVAMGFEPESFRASEVIVMRSDLKPTGSVYTPQAIIKLRD
ncbi:MAG TPA: RNA 2',3'-cyclic phosphodiesterase [Blastocatellia bacterium]|nr:RNA 2',3'-cyclic phosphodiesterase [Blastocatellia bacterium]